MKSGSGLATILNFPFSIFRNRGNWIFLSLALLLFSSARADLQIESSKDVGFGFRVVIKSGVASKDAWEVGHFGFLYYQDTELAQSANYSIAPSGKYALFQDGPTGEVVLFTTATAQRRVVAKFPGSLVEKYVWHERQHDATIVFEKRPSLRVALPPR